LLAPAYPGPVTDSRSERPRLRGLVVDWGGVLTASLDEAMGQWARADGVDMEHFRAVMRGWVGGRREDGPPGDGAVAVLEQAPDAGPAGTSPVHQLERGEIAPGEFERQLAAELARRGSPVRAEGLLGRMLGGLGTLDDDMLGLVRQARAGGLRTALLSNSWGDHYPEELWHGLFDAVVISGRVGMRKPDERIFRYTADRLGLEPAECVMVDDLPHNVAGAVASGMVGVRHTSYATTRDELEVLLGLTAR
jgi:epoxide hydrolase-like predicted phosphatase